jgi:hypothetical protein
VLAKLRAHLTYANVMATAAVFIALGGGAYAAASINGKLLKNRSVTAKKLKKNTLTGTEIKESKLSTVPKARNATLLDGRGPGAFLPVAGTAANAANAAKLGGVSPEGWVRRDCASNSGQIKGVATVTGSATYTTTFSTVPGYNCSGQYVEADHESMGRYQVRFTGSPVTQAVATAIVTGFSADAIAITNNGSGLFTIYIENAGGTAFVDDGFTLVAP